MFYKIKHSWWALLLALGLASIVLAMRQDVNRAEVERIPFSQDEQLIIFTQEEDEHFRTTCLPNLRTWAKTQGLSLRAFNAVEGLPSELSATPAIIFQNQRGRSIYAQRYAELTTIQNFVRSSRIRPQAAIPYCAADVLQTERGRARINVPVKLTELQGSLPLDWDAANFELRSLAAIQSGMTGYQAREKACLARTDRAFYADLHPYRNEEGELFLSLELYAMFNCIRPVWKTDDIPLQGDFTQYEDVFRQAGVRFAEEIDQQLRNSVIGDAWTPLATTVPSPSWEELGLALPAGAAELPVVLFDVPLAGSWGVSGAAIPGVPMLSFRFLAPLERYAGEVADFSGRLQLNADGELKGGSFTAGTRSLSMGMQELDDKVKRKYIYSRRYPKAHFRFDLEEPAPIKAGQVNRLAVPGTFTMLKKEIPLLVQAEITPQANTQGGAALYAHVSFEVNITDEFGIKGPDGPDPARKTLAFDLHFLLQQ